MILLLSLCAATYCLWASDDDSVPDSKLSRRFVARTDYDANLAIYGKRRRFIVYEEVDGLWHVVARVEGGPSSYPSVEIVTRASRTSPKALLISCWVQEEPGRFRQEPLVDGVQADDELGRHFWQWQCEPVSGTPVTDSGVIRFYRRSQSEANPEPSPPEALPWPKRSRAAKWGLLTIASGFYENAPIQNLPWANASAGAVASALDRYHPDWISTICAPSPSGLRAKSFLEEFRIEVEKSKARDVDFLIVYYLGHAAAVQDQDVWLFMGDLDLPDLRRLVRKPLLSADFDLDAPPPNYVLPVSRIAQNLKAAGMLYVLMVGLHKARCDRTQ